MQCWQAHQLLLLLLAPLAARACGPRCCLPAAHLACLTWMARGGCGRALPALLPVRSLGEHWTSAGCLYLGEPDWAHDVLTIYVVCISPRPWLCIVMQRLTTISS